VHTVILRQVFLRVPRFAPVSIIPPVFHVRQYLHAVSSRRSNGLIVGNPEKKKNNSAVSEIGHHWIAKYLHFSHASDGRAVQQLWQALNCRRPVASFVIIYR
jgi:hypothetical protein